MKRMGEYVVLLVILLLNSSFAQAQLSSGTFTYQGRLGDAGMPAAGTYDFEFSFYDTDDEFGVLIPGCSTVTVEDIEVSDGYFSVELDPGLGCFTGANVFLQIGVRPYDSTDAYEILEPRQQVTAGPMAQYAENASLLEGFAASSFLTNITVDSPLEVDLTDPQEPQLSIDFTGTGGLDDNYVNVDGDSMTGPLSIIPSFSVSSSLAISGTYQGINVDITRDNTPAFYVRNQGSTGAVAIQAYGTGTGYSAAAIVANNTSGYAFSGYGSIYASVDIRADDDLFAGDDLTVNDDLTVGDLITTNRIVGNNGSSNSAEFSGGGTSYSSAPLHAFNDSGGGPAFYARNSTTSSTDATLYLRNNGGGYSINADGTIYTSSNILAGTSIQSNDDMFVTDDLTVGDEIYCGFLQADNGDATSIKAFSTGANVYAAPFYARNLAVGGPAIYALNESSTYSNATIRADNSNSSGYSFMGNGQIYSVGDITTESDMRCDYLNANYDITANLEISGYNLKATSFVSGATVTASDDITVGDDLTVGDGIFTGRLHAYGYNPSYASVYVEGHGLTASYAPLKIYNSATGGSCIYGLNTSTGIDSSTAYLYNAGSNGYALYAYGNTYLSGDLTLTGTFSLGNLSATTITASGTITGGDLAATDDITVGDDLTVNDLITTKRINADNGSSNSVSITGTGTSTTYAPLRVLNTTATGGPAIYANNNSTSYSDATAYFNNSNSAGYALYTYGDSYLNGDLNVTGSFDISTINATTVSASDVSASDDITVGDDMTVTDLFSTSRIVANEDYAYYRTVDITGYGTSTSYAPLYVTNASAGGPCIYANNSSTGTADATAYFYNSNASGYALYASGDTYLNGDLTLTGTFSGNISTTGDVSAGDDMFVGDDIFVEDVVSTERIIANYPVSNGPCTQITGIGTSTSYAPLIVQNNAGTGGPCIYGYNTSTGTSDATAYLYNTNSSGYAMYAYGNVYVTGTIYGNLGKESSDTGKIEPVPVHYVKSQHETLEDMGMSVVENGEVRVYCDPLFLENVTIDKEKPLLVFITPYGWFGDYYVEPHADGFTLHTVEQNKVKFAWKVVAPLLKRKIDYPDTDKDEDPEQIAQANNNLNNQGKQ